MMLWGIITGGLGLGLLSSFHCVGMCGAMAFALPVQQLHPVQRVISVSLYHIGRVITYALLGLVFGSLGRQFYLAGWQQWISIGAGLMMLLLALQYFLPQVIPQWRPARKFHQRVASWISYLMKKKSTPAFLLLGMANGLLPCGMVYVAIAAALTLPNIQESVLFMSLFGAGTLPAMMALSYFGMVASLQSRNQFKKMIPVFVLAMGLLLILRGLNLGIPFISPTMPNQGVAVECH